MMIQDNITLSASVQVSDPEIARLLGIEPEGPGIWADLPVWAARGCPEDHADDAGRPVRTRDKAGRATGPYARRAPVNPHTGGAARSNRPATWGTRAEAEARAARWRNGRDPGVGIMLGAARAPDGLVRCALDLDGVGAWPEGFARRIVKRFASYTESSPSGTGLRVLFTVTPETLAALGGRGFARRAGEHLEIAFKAAGFVTVTGRTWPEGSPARAVRTVDLATVAWLRDDLAPAWHAAMTGAASGRDESGSGAGFRFLLDAARQGMTEEEAREAIETDGGDAGAWWARTDDRQRQRAVDNAFGRVEADRTRVVQLFEDDPADLAAEIDAFLGIAPGAGAVAVAEREPRVMRRKNGEAEPTAHNAILYLDRANRANGLGIRHNRFTGRDEWRAGEIRDADLTLIRVEIERAGLRSVGADLTARAVRAVAEANAHDPLADWLTGLVHDGVPRLSTWLSAYLGAEDSAWTRAVGRAALIGLVARAMQPGCKHDHVLCMVGPQGAGKSTACRILGGEWYGDNLPPLRHDDVEASRWLRGHWLVEISELAPTRKAEAETLKSFLSRTADKVREPYGRLAEAVPRRCAFFATTNDPEFIRDPTGGRRFWPVEVGEKADLDGLARDRSQLFAEAAAAFRGGEPWHLSPEMEAVARERQRDATEADPWADPIRAWLAGEAGGDGFDGEASPRERVTVAEALAMLGLPVERQRGAEGKRVSAILRFHGYVKTHTEDGNFWMKGGVA